MFECGSDGLKKECELFQKIILKSLFSEFILTSLPQAKHAAGAAIFRGVAPI